MADNLVETITVAYIALKPTQKGKQRWSVKSEAGEWYSIWDQAVAEQIQPKTTIMVGIEVNGDYKNIKSIIPPGMQGAAVEQSTTNAEEVVARMFDDLPPQPAAKPHVIEEIKLTIEERMRAFESATLLCAHGVIKPDQLSAMADKALNYYHMTSAAPKPTATTDIVTEYVK